jgi:hypothetical protein
MGVCFKGANFTLGGRSPIVLFSVDFASTYFGNAFINFPPGYFSDLDVHILDSGL